MMSRTNFFKAGGAEDAEKRSNAQQSPDGRRPFRAKPIEDPGILDAVAPLRHSALPRSSALKCFSHPLRTD